MTKVRESIRMLGTSFFQEMTGITKKGIKSKVYDQAALTVDDVEKSGENEDSAHFAGHEEIAEEDFFEALAQEGDEDAVFAADFETAATDVIQNDEDLAAAFTTYMEARRKLSEKYRSRGFWPVGKGKSKGAKGKSKGRFNWTSRKTLQQRILESNCRICGRKGHWKSECPNKGQSNQSSSGSTAPITLSMGLETATPSGVFSSEFFDLPEASSTSKDRSATNEFCFVQFGSSVSDLGARQPTVQPNMRVVRERIRNHIMGNRVHNPKVAPLVSRIESRKQASPTKPSVNPSASVYRSDFVSKERSGILPDNAHSEPQNAAKQAPVVEEPKSPTPLPPVEVAEAFFSTHDTWGILDTGATKTVMGSNFVNSFLKNVNPNVRKHIQRCPCDVTFRFGNQGTLKSEHAMIVPVGGLKLKIAIVPGSTPFLVSNTLLRALGALVDTCENQLILPRHNLRIPLKVTSKGLYLIDMNLYADPTRVPRQGQDSRNVCTGHHRKCS